MDDEKIAEVIERDLSGTSGVMYSHETVADALGVPVDEVMRVSGEIGVEMCAECGWWTFRDEANEHDGEVYCDDCVPEDDD